jgi:hypothetical protein
VREHLEWWAVIKKINLYNLPEIIRQHKISNCSNFIRHQEFFPLCPKCLGINGKSLEPYYTVPKIIGHHKIPKTPKTFKHEEFSGCPIF